PRRLHAGLRSTNRLAPRSTASPSGSEKTSAPCSRAARKQGSSPHLRASGVGQSKLGNGSDITTPALREQCAGNERRKQVERRPEERGGDTQREKLIKLSFAGAELIGNEAAHGAHHFADEEACKSPHLQHRARG